MLEFEKTSAFDATILSQFNIIIQGGQTVVMIYKNGLFTVNSSTGTGAIASTLIMVYTTGVSLPFTATITDSSDNVLSTYTVNYGEVDSSNLLTFGAIDETYARKTELDHNHDSTYAALNHTHTISEITD